MRRYVKVTKMAAVDEPVVRTPNDDEFEPGGINPGISLPVDYYFTGELAREVEVGRQVVIARDTRNGVQIYGTFSSSPVTRIEPTENGLIFYTLNSKYVLEYIENTIGTFND